MALSNTDFVHLHLHSDYSLLDGACRISSLMEHASRLGMPAVALTDHGNLFGAVDFYKKAKAHDLKPILGCEVYLVWDHPYTERPQRDKHKIYHMGLLARNNVGFANLTKLVSIAHTKGMYYRPRIDMDLLQQHSEGLIGFTGCLQGVIPQMLLRGDMAGAREACERFIGIFGKDHFFVEIQDHGIPEQQSIIPKLLKLGEEFGLKVVATNDVHYLRQQDWEPHDSLLCIQTGAKLNDEKRMRYDSHQFFFKDAREMLKLFPDHTDALLNTRTVAEMCEVELDFKTNHYPVYPLPPEIKSKNLKPREFMLDLCREGLRERYGIDYDNPKDFIPGVGRGENFASEVVERVNFEVSVIESTGFTDYFLIVWDFIDWARKKKISVGPGRGSGAGCIVAYLLKITDIDPLRFGLLFERFLNPERVSPPDFDIDFCMRRRGEVIEYVRQKYGEDCVASIITFGTLGAKMVLRDLARVMELSYSDGDRLAKMIPDDLNISLSQAVEKSDELRKELKVSEVAKRIFDQGLVIEGMVRNCSTHAAGIIIADQPLDTWVPLTLQEGSQGKGSVLTTQYPKEPVEELGLLKMDFLGLKTLTVIADAEANIRLTRDKDFSIETVSFEDQATFSLLNSGRTRAVFQLESEGMQALCRQFQISNIDEIIALIALYRPGPMDLIPDFVRGKHDPSTVKYAHPLLEDICKETYGVMVYQEQVMEAARRIAGYSLGGADILRRAMGKKKKEIMDEERVKFIKGAAEHNSIPKKKADEIFDLLAKFAGYGFNKSHSAAYAYLAYRTAYLKANYPVEFMAAVLSAELGKADKVASFISECDAMKIPVLGPDINESRENFTPIIASKAGDAGDQSAIRFGLSAIKGVGESAARVILEERDRNGPFKNFIDFAERVDLKAVNRRVLECLIKTGAFENSGQERAQLLAGLDAILAHVSSQQKDRAAGQISLFDMGGDSGQSAGFSMEVELPNVPPMPAAEQQSIEKELLGFYLSGHPLDRLGPLGRALNTHDRESMANAADKTPFRLTGILTGIAKRLTRRDNKPWASFSLHQPDDQFNLTLFPDAFSKFGSKLEEGKLAIVFGLISIRNNEMNLNAEEIHFLEPVVGRMIQQVTWFIQPEADVRHFLDELRQVLEENSGSTRVKIAFDKETGRDQIVTTIEVDSCLNWLIQVPDFLKLYKHPAVKAVHLDPVPLTWESTRGQYRNRKVQAT